MISVRRIASLTALAVLVMALPLLTPGTAVAQERSSVLPRVSPNASISQSIGVTTVEIHYGRPAVRDRTIFGDLVSYGEVWRTGANEATAIAFSSPVIIEGESLDAGMYSLFTIPGEDEWTLIFNDTVEQWGAYNYDESKDVLRVSVEPMSGPKHERLTFGFTNLTDTSATMKLMWDETHVPVDITVDTRSIIAQRGDTASEDPESWQAPLRYAGYALQNDVLLDKALSWANASLDVQESFPGLAVKAQLQAKMGKYDDAVATAERAVAMAEDMEDTPRGVSQLQASMEEWKSK
jgi:hypothetical protein